MLQLDLSSFYTIGHRGADVCAVENTLPAFQLASDLGLDFAELDVQMSSDGIPVVFHDASLSPKTDRQGKVADYTADDLQRIEVSTTPGRAHIPTFEAVLQHLQPTRTNLIVEIKSRENHPSESTHFRTIGELIERYGFHDRVIIDSFKFETVERFRRIYPDLMYSWLVRKEHIVEPATDMQRVLDQISEAGFHAASFHIDHIFESAVRLFHGQNRLIFAYGVREEAQYRRALSLGLNGFTAPDPRMLLGLLKFIGLR